MFTQNKKSKFLMYHAFSETYSERYCMNINQFRDQKINNDYILTFDDGSESLYRYRDIIFTKGQAQILFIRTDKINRKNYLSSTQIQYLSNYFKIQSHSHSHPNHFLLNDREIRQDGIISKQNIENITGNPVKFYAFPGGDFSFRSIKILAEIGYREFFTSVPLFVTRKMRYNGVTLNIHGRVEIFGPGFSTIERYYSLSVLSRRLLRHIFGYSNRYIRSRLK
tara:strand:+ start:1884 stop:2552 length:669 start_codon:yes stop_codon:yes gene_type:complete